MKNYITILMALSTLFVLVATTSQASNYELTIFGTLGGYFSSASGINDSAQVVGSATETGWHDTHAFLWENGVMTDLGTLPGDNTSGARSINNNGLIVGISGFTDEYGYGNYKVGLGISDFTEGYGYGYGNYKVGFRISGLTNEYGPGNYNACLWKNVIPVNLGITTWAEDINDSGQIVGGYLTWEYNLPAWLWENGVITYLGTMVEGQESVATAINNLVQIVGYANTAQPSTSNRLNAYIWEDGEMKTLENLPGPTNNAPYTQAWDINDEGQVVGRAAGKTFLWENGTVTWLTLKGASDINNKGQVVGSADFFTENGYGPHAALLDSTYGLQDLNDLIAAGSSWILTGAAAINENGQIVGSAATDPDGDGKWDAIRGFLLTPIPQTITVTSPNGGETLFRGIIHEIKWFSIETIERVIIEYSVNNGTHWIEIVASTESDGSYDWVVPNNPSGECLVRVSDVDGDPSDESNAVFSICSGLLFTPVTPCRIVDTRNAVGAIQESDLRSYVVYGDRDTIGFQGGNSAGCPSPQGEPYAVDLNVTAVPVTGQGHLRMFPFNTPTPNASMLNYSADAGNMANAASVKTCYGCGKDVHIQNFGGTTHVVIDVMGYYNAAP